MEVLALCAWCKDLPIADAENIPTEIVQTLFSQGLFRQSQCGLSWRVTEAGYALLAEAGMCFEQDKQYLGKSPALYRRLQMAASTGFFWRCGADVFRETSHTEMGTHSFLPSFALRRKQSANILGGTQLAGFYYTDRYVFIPYFIPEESNGVYPEVEQRTFRSEGFLCGRTPYVLYTGSGDLGDILRVLRHPIHRNPKTTTESYMYAISKWNCPVAICPLNGDGMRQLRILEIPDLEKKLVRMLLGHRYASSSNTWSDGKDRASGDPYLVGIDCNIQRFEIALRNNSGSTHIFLMPFQTEAVAMILKGQPVILHPIEMQVIEQCLGLPMELPEISGEPFQTEEGRYMHVQTFGKDQKNRGYSRKLDRRP